MEKLAQGHTALVLDALTGRLAMERTGVLLYDTVIQKIERTGEPRYHVILGALRTYREEEKEHRDWLESQIRALGGNPDETTTMAQLELEESQGIKSVIVDGHSKVLHLLHALLAAEMADNAGWDLLVKLAGERGDTRAKAAFARRLAEEVKHLAFVREAVVRASEVEILGEDKEMPRSVAAVGRRPLFIGGLSLLGVVASLGAVLLGLRFGGRRLPLSRRARMLRTVLTWAS